MSGLTREEVSRRFTEADRLLRQQGFRTVNPARVWVCRWRWLYRLLESIVGRERAYDLVLIYDLWLLSHCKRIYMVGDDWRDISRGATTEYYFAELKGMEIDDSEEDEALISGLAKAHEWMDKELERLEKEKSNEQNL